MKEGAITCFHDPQVRTPVLKIQTLPDTAQVTHGFKTDMQACTYDISPSTQREIWRHISTKSAYICTCERESTTVNKTNILVYVTLITSRCDLFVCPSVCLSVCRLETFTRKLIDMTCR